VQEAIGLERNQAWVGRTVDVLVDAIATATGHGHGDDLVDGRVGADRVSGRTRGNKLVHLDGGEALVGSEVAVRIDHAGPYALRGTAVTDVPTAAC
jgi:tRNA-2-methylthio-N6-dimethylallyladenosine synthase